MSLNARLSKRKKLGNLRQLQIKENLIDFASNDYLGLSRSEDLKKKVLKEWLALEGPLNGLGSTGSRLLTGNSAYAEELEEHIASFHGYESALIFSCGYMANMGLIGAIAGPEDLFFFDSEIHASLREGMVGVRGKRFPFRHNDLDHLEKRLKNNPSKQNRFICVESVYSTDGSLSSLEELYCLSQKYGAKLIVDEAHGVGLFGRGGRGRVFEAGLSGEIFAQIITCGKALGTFGAIVLGHRGLKEILINFARPYIYSTALPLHSLAAIKGSYALFPQLEKERKTLFDLIQRARLSPSPIQPIPLSSSRAALELVEHLFKEGFDVRALLSPTVRRGKERIRMCLHAFNTKTELTTLLALMRAHG